MRVELRNIGPVNRGALDLDGLSLLVGPNASGKTTLSTVCYAVLKANEAAHQLVTARLNRLSLQSAADREIREELSGLGDRFASSFRELLSEELQRCFSADLAKLPRRGRGGAGSAPRIFVSDDNTTDGQWNLVFRVEGHYLTLETSHPDYRNPHFPGFIQMVESGRFVGQLLRRRRLSQRVNPVYFPAGRSGYVQMYKVLSSILLAALGRGYYDDIALGKISGIAADFLQFLGSMDARSSSRLGADQVRQLERELLHGYVRLLRTDEYAQNLEFFPEGLEESWPMDSAATSVAELAPLLVYLKHRADTSDLVFFDEPEAHLHPANQILIARVLVELAESLRGMVIGTHSEFLATGISNTLLQRITEAPESDAIKFALYELRAARPTGGFEAVRVEADLSSGFAVDQFVTVAEQALDEAESLFVRAQQRASE